MQDSIIGLEYLPNIYIEKIFLQTTNTEHNITVKLCMYDFEEKSWSLDDRFTGYFSVIAKFLTIDSDINQIKNGETNLKNLNVESSNTGVIPFSSFTETSETIRSKKYTKYIVNFSTSIDISNKNISFFCCTSIDTQQLKDNNNLDMSYSNQLNYLGSVKSEAIIEGGLTARNVAFIFKDENETPWTGPVHKMPDSPSNEYMAGSVHGAANEKLLFLSSLESLSKIEEQIPITMIFSSEEDIPTRPSEPGAPPSYFTVHQEDFVEDISRNVSNTIVADVASIVLRESETASIMNNFFPEKFTEIADSTNIQNIEINRFPVLKSKAANRLGLFPFRPDFSQSTLIAKSHNNRQKVKNKTLFKISPTEIISIDPKKLVKNSKRRFFNGRNLTLDMIKNAPKIGKVEQIDLSLPSSLRPINFIDYSIKNAKSGRYKYQIKISIKDQHLVYCKELLKNLIKMEYKIQNLHNILVIKNVFNGEEFELKFLQEFYSQYNIKVNTKTGFVEGEFNTQLLQDSYLVKSFELLLEAERLIGTKPTAQLMVNNLNLFTTNLDKIQNTAIRFRTIIERFKNVYNLSDGQSYEKYSSKSKKHRGIIEKKITLRRTYKRELLKPIGMNFIDLKPKNEGLPMINLLNFDSRTSKEVSKFFPGPISTNSNTFSFLSDDEKNFVSNIEETKYMNFSPAKIFLGKQEVDTTEINTQSFNADFFNTLRVVSAVLESEDNIDPENNIDEQKIEKYLDSREFLGDSTKFNDIIIASLRFKPLILPKIRKKFKFLDNSILKAKKTNISLKTFDLKQPNNIVIAKLKQDPKSVPLQMKALSLLNTPLTNFDLDTINFDPVSNPQTQEVFMQNYLNINKVQALMGFEKVNGRFMMNKPIYKEINTEIHEKLKNMNVLCRLVPQSLDGIGVNQKTYNVHDKVFVLHSNNTQVGEEDA